MNAYLISSIECASFIPEFVHNQEEQLYHQMVKALFEAQLGQIIIFIFSCREFSCSTHIQGLAVLPTAPSWGMQEVRFTQKDTECHAASASRHTFQGALTFFYLKDIRLKDQGVLTL